MTAFLLFVDDIFLHMLEVKNLVVKINLSNLTRSSTESLIILC